ncbi:SEC-C domain-containing protein [Marinobacter santoriniensis]|uniref:SEC-C domain-containing protein n=1 Tax=Marinobacter santoriniensis TaxID=523742 RepID=UPI00135F10ED|nr:SEC-C domain-containing protein [Marinobacter santoriniensis]
MGSVLDGVFNITGSVIEVLSAPSRTTEQLKVLSEILQSAVASEKEADEIASEIQSKAPSLGAIARFIPKNSTELVAWLTFVLLAIQTLMQMDEKEAPDVNLILNQSVEQSMNPKNYYPYRPAPDTLTRNAPCPCGSGERYKRCCGRGI